jgi:hypothetical protein
MATVAENLQALQNIKTDIASAITEKGQSVEGVAFSGYADKIRAIQAGGGGSSDGWLTRYLKGETTEVSEAEFVGIESIPQDAFRGNVLITKVLLPDTVKSLGIMSFAYCSKISEIKLSNAITTLPGNAFESCTTLTYIKIPKSVKTIQSNAFKRCKALAVVDFRDSDDVVSIAATNVFLEVFTCTIIIPNGLYDKWTKATNWSSFASQSGYSIKFVEAKDYKEA